jgi:hypothetical protein
MRPFLIILIASVFLSSCMSARSISMSAKATPEKQVVAGWNSTMNIPTQTISDINKLKGEVIEKMREQEDIVYNEDIDLLSRVVFAQSLDPLGLKMDISLRYGLAKRFDTGYKYTFGGHVFDVRYQFLGSTANMENPSAEKFYGSIGLQFGTQKSEMPEILMLDKIKFIEFIAKRKDLLMPLIFSYSLGPEEMYGAFSFGMVYTHSFLSYGVRPHKIFYYSTITGEKTNLPSYEVKNNFGSVGGFVNIKLGFKYIYAVPSIAVYYQNYGEYILPGGNMARFKGFTILPAIGIIINPLGK